MNGRRTRKLARKESVGRPVPLFTSTVVPNAEDDVRLDRKDGENVPAMLEEHPVAIAHLSSRWPMEGERWRHGLKWHQ